MKFIGIDISKATFDVAVMTGGQYKNSQFDNSQTGFNAFLKWMNLENTEMVKIKSNNNIYSKKRKIVKPSDQELKLHQNYLKQQLKKNFFN